MKNFLFLSFLLIAMSASFYGCSLIGEEDSCADIEGFYNLEKIGDESLPYTAYYIDSNNNSQITKGLHLFLASTWSATLYNKVTSDGSTSTKEVKSNGNYTCDDGVVRILNEKNEAGGTGTIHGDRFLLGADSGYDYVWVKQ